MLYNEAAKCHFYNKIITNNNSLKMFNKSTILVATMAAFAIHQSQAAPLPSEKFVPFFPDTPRFCRHHLYMMR